MKSPEVIAEDILSSFSEKEIDRIIDILTEGITKTSGDIITQGSFFWVEEEEEKWNQTRETITGKMN